MLSQITKSKETSKNHGFKAPVAIFMGPQRAGTSWIHRYLSSRKDVCLPKEVKELFFFDFNFEQGEEFYFSHFQEEPFHKMAIEVSATYFTHPEAPKRIYEYFGENVKLVCPLRHPVKRSYSLYKHYQRYGMTDGDLFGSCKKNPEILLSSHYKSHLENWGAYFDLKKMHICLQEDLDKDQDQFVKDLCNYLEIPFKEIPKEARNYYNVGTRPPVKIVAKIAHIGAEKLRALRLYWIINLAKTMGLKKLIFGLETAASSSSDISSEERTFLEHKLSGQIKELEAYLGREIISWRD